MEENKLPSWLQSSADPAKLAASIKGALTLLVGIAGVFGIDVPNTLIDEVVEVGVSAVGALLLVFGLVRKVVIWYQNRESE